MARTKNPCLGTPNACLTHGMVMGRDGLCDVGRGKPEPGDVTTDASRVFTTAKGEADE